MVHGRVVDFNGVPAADVIVGAFDKDVAGENPLGESTTHANGEYRIPYTEEAFRRSTSERRGPDVLVRAYDAGRSLLFTSKTYQDADRELRIDITLPEPKLVVRGRISGAKKGMLVFAYDKDLRSEQQLGKPCELAGDGIYAIEYRASEFARAEKGGADLRISVCEPGGRELHSSEIFFNAASDATIDLPLTGAQDSSPSEYTRYLRDLEPLLQGIAVAKLEEPKDVDFIVGDTGIERPHIEWLIAAARLEGSEISAAIFYGWFRLGMPTDPSALWERSTDELLSTLKAAIHQHLIPAISDSDQERIEESIKQFKLHQALRSRLPGTDAGLGDLLATLPSPPALDQQLALAAALNTLRPDDPQLVERVAAVPGFDGDAAAVARTLRLGALTARHLPLTKALQARLQKADENEGTLRPLAMMRPDEWIDLAYAHGTPDGTASAPAEFADTLAAQVEREYPTMALAANLKEGRPLAQHPLLRGVDTFLRDNPTFDIVSANLNALRDQTKLDGVTDPDQLGRGLLALQRFNALGATWHDTAILLEQDLSSPQQLLAAGPEQLTELFEGQLAPERIVALHDRAAELHNVTFAAVTAAFSPLSGPNVLPGNGEPSSDTEEPAGSVGFEHVLSLVRSRGRFEPNQYKFPRRIDKETLDRTRGLTFDDVVSNQPTLQYLFGSQDACTCKHCSSVLSPAAYFVDLLQFIKNASPNAQLLHRLLQRRPDLQDIELSCGNTHTEVPAIDLALEILENAVALPLPIDLPPGTTLDEELRDARPVGAAVRTALEKTVRNFAGEGQATSAGVNGDGTTDWTVIDRHRRWTLSARPENDLIAQAGQRGPHVMDTTGVNVAALIKALDGGTVGRGSEVAFARLIAPNRESDYSNYRLTVTPATPGRAWSVAYGVVTELVVEAEIRQITLRIPGGKSWSVNRYDKKTIQGIREDLVNRRIPELVRLLIVSRFPDAGRLRLEPVESRLATVWTIASDERTLTLTYTPAHLTITSLAYQSGDPSVDAIAEPENHNPEAYARLKAAAFPWSLPLDLPLEDVRLFLERARSSRRQLMESMVPVDAVDSANPASLANEVLGLSEAEAALIGEESATPAVYDQWGIPETQDTIFDAATGRYVRGTPPLVLLRNVSILLQQSRLSFEELQVVIETQFVTRRGTAPLIIMPRSTCKPSEMKLLVLTTGHLDRVHRFVRLWRRLGWTAHELDLAIEAFGGQLTSETLVALAGVKRLKQDLGLSVAVLVGGLDRLETQPWVDYLADEAPERPSLYAAIFQRDAVRKVTDFAAFALRPDGVDLQNTPNSGISAHAEYVGNCIGVRTSVVTEWVAAGNAVGVVDTLDLANLSRLTAAASLCTALRIEPEQLTHHLKLQGTSPFRAGITVHERLGATLEFVEKVRGIAKAGIDAETLRYVLQHYEVPGSDANVSAVQRTQLAAAARDAVRSIPDATGDAAAAAATVIAREDAVIAALAAGFSSARELVDELLRNRLRHPSDGAKPGIDALLATEFTTSEVSHSPTAAIPPAVTVDAALKAKVDKADAAVDDLIVRLHKSLLLCNALTFTTTELSLLRVSANAGSGFTALNVDSLPVRSGDPSASIVGFEQLLALARLRSLAPKGGDLLHRYIRPADAGAAWSTAGARRVLATGFAVTDGEVEAAAKQITFTTAGQYRDPIALTRLVSLLAALKKLGATVKLAAALTSSSPDDATAIGARELLRSKYGESQWHDLIKPIEDALRERQRGALVDYLVARDERRDADDLYEHYLIDVHTGSCMKTTRLLQATAAVQLFVQRVTLNLESGASLSADKRALWDWMHSYRVWEANRKVFLFPENWLLPELRDDKTALFREMESALSENEPSQESMRAALLAYVDGLGELAQINVIAMYEDRRPVGDPPAQTLQSTLYVIGRTPNQPYRYFWRSSAHFGDSAKMFWSGWEALDLDNASDFIMPFVFEGDLHVAWPVFRRTKSRDDENELEWEVQLAWTRRATKGWTKRKLSTALLTVSRLPNKDEGGSFVYRLSTGATATGFRDENGTPLMRETIRIDCYAANERNPIKLVRADPGTDVLTHFGDRSNLYNTLLEIQGVLFDYATVDRENTNRKRPLSGIKVTANYWSRFRQNLPPDVGPFSTSTTTDANGAFRIVINTQSDDKAGVLNGTTVSLVLDTRDGDSPTVERVSKDLGSQTAGFFPSWKWKLNVGIKSEQLKTFYHPNRPVDYKHSGAFVIESGRDVRLEAATSAALPPPTPTSSFQDFFFPGESTLPLAVEGNRFADVWEGLLEGFRIDNIVFDADGALLPSALVQTIEAPFFVARASQATLPLARAETFPWYLQERRRGYYLLKQAGAWSIWPDGQRFTSDYRTVAAISTSALFGRQVQAQLVDALTDNFSRSLPYANYNWELFLHLPLAIADFLASQQRFEDARRWLHAVFDPTTDKATNNIPQFWRFLPFHNDSQPDGIAKLLTWLADPDSGDPAVESALTSHIEEWKRNPFMPHLIARLRPSAYQWHTFFAYLNVLIKWGDQLFRRDTRESVNEATLLYVLAAKLLGPRPRTIQPPASLPPQTYRTLSASALDDFSNAWVQYADLPGVRKVLAFLAAHTGSSYQASLTAQVLGKTSYQSNYNPGIQLLTSFGLAFCIPQNDRLTEFYDLIEKRLFDIRHCRNIDGVFRELPLYDPPIDPLLLIRARAAGLDIATVVAELYAPLPNYRFTFTLQKALELCAEVKSLGGALLTALEKQDAEGLALLRSTHEIAMLKLARDVRQKQVDEADANIVALQQSQATATERFSQYQKLLGKNSITKGQDGFPVVEQSSPLSISTDPVGGASGLALSRMEVAQLQFSAMAHLQTQIAGSIQVVAGVVSLIPNIFAGTPFAGQTSGGTNFGIAANAVAKSVEMIAAEATYLASQAGTFGGFERRQDEWVHQSKLALAELKQLDKQILAAQIRKSIAQNELDNHDQQIENANEVDDFMRSKFTNQQLFRWMSSQIAEVYFRTYQLALDQARRAERTCRHELGLDDATTKFVQSDSWDSLKRGLLAGERLHHDLKRMESAYLERNVREFELTKHVSLLQLDPLALIELREAGSCDFAIPEALFDLDNPGHYMRRIKMVSLSIPCVAGPYASVSATLQLKKNETRVKPSNGTYPHQPDDSRFTTRAAPIMAIVTSNAQQDSGMFEPNMRDERYLPFEGAGVISTWHLELPGQFRQFDYAAISDVILHIRYTSRRDGDLKDAAVAYLGEQIGRAEAAGMVRLFSVRHEFPSAWAKFIAVKIDGTNVKTAELSLELRSEHYPFWSTGRLKSVERAEVIAKAGDDVDSIEIAEKADGTGDSDTLDRPTDPNLSGLLAGTLEDLAPKSPVTEPNKPFKLYFKENAISELWIAIAWKGPA